MNYIKIDKVLTFRGEDTVSFLDSLISNEFVEGKIIPSFLLFPDGKINYWFLAEKQIEAVESASIDMEFETKTPAQRMRAVMYRLWEQQSPKQTNENGDLEYVEFELFYKRKMNEIINHLKSKLD